MPQGSATFVLELELHQKLNFSENSKGRVFVCTTSTI